MADRYSLDDAVRGLLVAENLGDIHDQWNLLCQIAGLDGLDGDYFNGFSGEDERKLAEAIRYAASEPTR